ncbi:unnamed protein product, partial [Mycena citricolor]
AVNDHHSFFPSTPQSRSAAGMRTCQCWILLFAVAGLVSASSGDRAPEFTNCVSRCNASRCASGHSHPLSLPLRLTRWTCDDNCKYSCMQDIATRDIRLGDRVHQYYGKWPFWRLFGVQEPASVLFSLLNLWAHARGLAKLRRQIPETHPMKPYYLAWAVTGINAWVWSAVFHTRDNSTTERLDYFSAALTITYALYYTVVRLFHLYPTQRRGKLTLSTPDTATPRSPAYKFWSALCLLAYVGHVSYLTLLPRFDYTYNIVFNTVIGLAHNILWLLYAFPSSLSTVRRFSSRPKTYRPDFATRVGVLVLCTTAATTLELFDFAPFLRIIDAHSLWHLATAPIAVFWYEFLLQDSRDESWRDRV